MLQCIVLEPTKQFHEQLSSKYKEFFSNVGYDSTFTFVDTEKNLRQILSKSNVDIFISDLSFNTEDFAGLLIVRSIKQDYPDIYIIGNSGVDIGYRQVAARLPSFDMFVEKCGLYANDSKYLNVLRNEFLSTFKRNPDIIISKKSTYLKGINNKIKKRDFESLVSQVLFFNHNSDNTIIPKEAFFTPICDSGGKSGSFVSKLFGQNHKGEIITVPAIFKISSKENALREKDNYDAFVKWILPYSCRVDILGFGITKSLGAICYSFIKSDYEDFDSLTKYMIDQNNKIIETAINEVFHPSKRHWYSKHFLSGGRNINERYYSRYFGSGSSKNLASKLFNDSVQTIFGAKINSNYINVLDRDYVHPVDRLFGRPNGFYHTCICHGDLNSNNIIVSESGEFIFIDFQETGRGHVFEDFITLESSLRLYYPDDREQIKKNEWLDIIDMERKICRIESQENYSNLFKHISLIRNLANNNFPFEDFSNYYYGIAAFNLRLLRLKGLTSSQIGRIIITILVALENLD